MLHMIYIINKGSLFKHSLPKKVPIVCIKGVLPSLVVAYFTLNYDFELPYIDVARHTVMA